MKFDKVEKKYYKTNELTNNINFINSLGIETPPHEFINFVWLIEILYYFILNRRK